MLRLTHDKFQRISGLFAAALALTCSSVAWALAKAPPGMETPVSPRFASVRPFLPNLPDPTSTTPAPRPATHSTTPPATLPAALDPRTDLEDQSDTTRQGLSRRAMLLSVADDYAEATHVPYVWGGNKVGTPSECDTCRTCLNKQRRTSVQRRHRACASCQSCGMDCSHFVNRIYRDAGMSFPYVTTRVLKKTSPEMIRRKFGLVSVGKDLSQAKPGDLILKEKHIVMLLQMKSRVMGDILHVSRSISRRGVGGVELRRDVDLRRFSGRLVRIFRHEAVLEEDLRRSPDQSAPSLAPRFPGESPEIDWYGRRGLLVYLDALDTATPWRPIL